MITVQNLQHTYKNQTREFTLDIDHAAFDQPGITAVLGPNGSGKSTLLHCIAGILRPRRGAVRFHQAGTWRSYEKIKYDIQLISQVISPWEQSTGRALLRLQQALCPDRDEALEAGLIEELGVPMDDPFGTLSRGEQARLKILLTLCRQPAVVLIDELTNDLDTASRRIIFKKLDHYTYERNALVIIATNIVHDMERYATRIFLLREGRLILDEETDSLKERHKKIVLRAGPGYTGGSIQHLQHSELNWNGKTGFLTTSRYDPGIPGSLHQLGIETTLESLPLEDIISEEEL